MLRNLEPDACCGEFHMCSMVVSYTCICWFIHLMDVHTLEYKWVHTLKHWQTCRCSLFDLAVQEDSILNLSTLMILDFSSISTCVLVTLQKHSFLIWLAHRKIHTIRVPLWKMITLCTGTYVPVIASIYSIEHSLHLHTHVYTCTHTHTHTHTLLYMWHKQ